MTRWNYRVIRKPGEDALADSFQIHEVYYRDDGSIECWTQTPVEPLGISETQLRNDIHAFLAAFRLPILREVLRNGRAVLVAERSVNPRERDLQVDYKAKAGRASGYLNQILGSHLLLKQDDDLRNAYEQVDRALTALYALVDRKLALPQSA
ncbi:MAG TPA: hypothetical protein VL027_08200 [Spongiibacteraceae bacterium]|jgi:hypothetical protein|nr:hypothetical protein [Spongiibacteraceae bacterium]HUH37910.1 hypothetical protein [Spongiibacteraceae bacterium]